MSSMSFAVRLGRGAAILGTGAVACYGIHRLHEKLYAKPSAESLAQAIAKGRFATTKTYLASYSSDVERREALLHRNCHHGTALGTAVEKGDVRISKLVLDHLSDEDAAAGSQCSTIEGGFYAKDHDDSAIGSENATAAAIALKRCAWARNYPEGSQFPEAQYPCEEMLDLLRNRGVFQVLGQKEPSQPQAKPSGELLIQAVAAKQLSAAKATLAAFANDAERREALLHRNCHHGTALGVAVEKGDVPTAEWVLSHLSHEDAAAGNQCPTIDDSYHEKNPQEGKGTAAGIVLKRCEWARSYPKGSKLPGAQYPCDQMLDLLRRQRLLPKA